MIDCSKTIKNDAPAHVLSDYTLAFEDVFKGQTQLDSSKWNTAYAWGPDITINGEEQYYPDVLGGTGLQGLANPFSFNQNGLVIEAAPLNDSRTDRTYTSGVITTRDSFCFKYGYVEVCLKDPCCPSEMWTAAWLFNCIFYDNADEKNAQENNGTGNRTFNPEIDFKETVDGGNVGCDMVSQAYHFFRGDKNNPPYTRWDLGSNFRETAIDGAGNETQISNFNLYQDCAGVDRFELADAPIEECEFHTVGVEWCEDKIVYYVNGEPTNCITNNFKPDSPIITDQSMYLIINFAVGGAFPNQPGPANQADYPAQLEVEYARIYTK